MPHAVAQSLAIGPIAGAGFIAFLVAGAAGSAAPLVVLLAAAGTLALGWTFAAYGRHIAGPGSVYEYASAAFGARAGGVVALYYFAGLLLLFPFALGTSLLSRELLRTHVGVDPGWWAIGVLSLVVVLAAALRSIRLSTRLQLLLTVLSAVPFLVLAGAVIAAGGEQGHTLRVLDPFADSAGDVFRAMLFALVLFGGFETAAALGEEVDDPHRTVPRAMLLTIAICGLFVALMMYVATIGFGPDAVAATWGEDPTAFAALGDRYVGSPLSAVLSIAIAVDLLAVQAAWTNSLARGLLALARDGHAPRSLARLSSRNVPARALGVVSSLGAAVLAAGTLYDDPLQWFEALATATGIVGLTVYAVLAMGARRVGGPRLPVVAVAVAAPGLALYGTVHPWPQGHRLTGLILAAAILGLAAAWTWLSVRGTRARSIR